MSRLRAGTPVALDGITIIPIEEVDVYGRNMKRGYWLHGSKKAAAIVFCDPQGVRAFDMHANELSLKQLVSDVNGLDVLLKKRAGQ